MESSSLCALAIALATVAAPTGAGTEEEAPEWLTFDVLNPEEAGRHRILHLEDLLGLGARPASVADLPSARAILLFTVLSGDCDAREGVCAEVGKIAREVRAQGGLVIGVLLDPEEAVPRARKEIPAAHHPFIVAADAHGITRHALRLDRPGEIIVINSLGRFVRFSQPSETADDVRRKLEDAKRAFVQALRRDKEE